MSVSLSALGTVVILLDVEGTTTPIAFVHGALFPFARARAGDFLKRHGDTGATHHAVRSLQDELAVDQASGAAPPALILDYVHWLMDRDRKSPGLKTLQGLIWQEGFEAGELRGQVYADVPAALERWSTRGLEVDIYSSGSVLAQRLLFESTAAGDLTRYLSAYFDTDMGPKSAPDSYQRIAEHVSVAPSQILFVSDVEGELDAAQAAGMRTALCMRQDSPVERHAHTLIRTFDDIVD